MSEGVGHVDLGGVQAGQHRQEASQEAGQPAQADEAEGAGPGGGGCVAQRPDHDGLEPVPADQEQVEDGHGAHRDVQGVVNLAHCPTQRPPTKELHRSAGQHHLKQNINNNNITNRPIAIDIEPDQTDQLR